MILVLKIQRYKDTKIRFNWHHNYCDEAQDSIADFIEIDGVKLITHGTGGDTDLTLFTGDDFDVRYSHVKRLFGGLKLSKEFAEINDEVYLPQYGNGGLQPTHIADRHENDACKIVNIAKALAYNCDTQPGSSGSPLLSKKTHELVGLHYAGGESQNHGVRTDILWQYLGKYVNDDNNLAILPVDYPVYSKSIELSQLSFNGEIKTFEKPIYFSLSDSEQLIENTHNRTLLTMVKKDLHSQKVAVDYENKIELWLENNCGQSPINKMLSCTHPGETKLKYQATPEIVEHMIHKNTKFWLPLTIHNKNNKKESELVINFKESWYDVFTPPFNAHEAEIHTFNFAKDQKNYLKIYTISPNIGFTSFYTNQGPTKLEWINKTPTIIPVLLQNNNEDAKVFYLRVTRVSDCSSRSMNTTASCSDGSGPIGLNIEFDPQINAQLPDGKYSGILPIKMGDWKDSNFSRNILVKLQFNNGEELPVYRPPVAYAGNDQTVIGPVNIMLDGSKSSAQDAGILSYSWKQIAGPNVNLENENTVKPRFALDKTNKEETLIFSLIVSDGKFDSKAVTVRVTNKPQPGSDEGQYPVYKSGSNYKAGDKVIAADGNIYECKPWPHTTWCGAPAFAYAPATGSHWSDAWIRR